jgi:hypothetical protein
MPGLDGHQQRQDRFNERHTVFSYCNQIERESAQGELPIKP